MLKEIRFDKETGTLQIETVTRQLVESPQSSEVPSEMIDDMKSAGYDVSVEGKREDDGHHHIHTFALKKN